MEQLISQEMLDRDLRKEVTIEGATYKTIFRYTGGVVLDAHEVEVGFIYPTGEEAVGKIFLPSVRPDGLLARNKSVWHRVSMLIPPVAFVGYGSTPTLPKYLDGLLSGSRSASKLDDFFPKQFINVRPAGMSPLMTRLMGEGPKDIRDMYNWLVIDVATATIECFNQKIISDIRRSRRGGFRGISAAVRGVHALVASFTRFHSADADDDDADEYEVAWDSEEVAQFLGRIGTEDRKGVVIMHPIIKSLLIKADTPVDFCSCSQSFPMRTGRLKDGVTVKDCQFASRSTFAYTRWRRAIVGIMSDDPRRVIVSRAITRALRLDEPMEPYAGTEVELKVDSLSLPGVRMTHPLNYEDSIVVSETFARKASAWKILVDKFMVPASSSVEILRQPFPTRDKNEIRSILSGPFTESPYVVRRGETVAKVQYQGLDGETETKELRSSAKVRAVLIKVEQLDPVHDLEEPQRMYRFVYLAFLPLNVGDKVADGHGNKATISAIWPDERMPVWKDTHGNEIKAHYLATPYIMKRLAVGAEIEDRMALAGFCQRSEDEPNVAAMLESGIPVTLDEIIEETQDLDMDYRGTVTFDGQTYEGVPLSLRAMYRLDNNAKETLTTRTGVTLDEGVRQSRNIRLGLDVVTMLARGANALVHSLIEESGSSAYLKAAVVPMLHALSGMIPQGAATYPVTKRLPRELLGNPTSAQVVRELDLEGTACDPRCTEAYGVIAHGKERIVVPPHAQFGVLESGAIMPDAVAVAANRVIAEIVSEASAGKERTNVQRTIGLYADALGGMLAGKGGLLRDALLPVFPVTCRAVVTPYVGKDPLEIRVPEREFRRICRQNEEFAERYQKTIEGGSAMYCLLKRDPVHRAQNVIAVKFRTWNRDSIGVSPLMIGTLDGDFDGDVVVAMFPTTWMAYHDMQKMMPEFKNIFAPGKQLLGSTPETALTDLHQRIGWTSTFYGPHESDVLKNPELFYKLLEGMLPAEHARECVEAARDFEVIKDGTAATGALGLTFIFTRLVEDRDILHDAMELYHVLAQNTLSAKAGTHVPSLDVVAAFRKGEADRMAAGLKSLDFTHQETIDQLLELSADIQQVSDGYNRMAYVTEKFPVFAMTQRGAGTQQAVTLAKKFASGPTVGNGVWEVLFDYLLGRAEKTPYEWSSERWDLLMPLLKKYAGTGLPLESVLTREVED